MMEIEKVAGQAACFFSLTEKGKQYYQLSNQCTGGNIELLQVDD